jgi:ABC-type transporter MlaC component
MFENSLRPSTESGFFRQSQPAVFVRLCICFMITILITFFSLNAHAVTRQLVFDPSPDTRVIGYKLYYGQSENFGITVDLEKKTSYDLPDLEEGATYYFAATAYDEYLNESVFSEILTYTVPINNNNTFTILASADTGGSISPSGNIMVNYDGSQNFTISPDSGHKIQNVVVDGVSMGEISTYKFENVISNHTISVNFEAITHIIVASADTGGSISPSGNVMVNYDGNQSFSITTDSGHKIQNVVVDGVSMGEISTYKFENVISNHTISANFEAITHIIVASADTGGSISPSGNVMVNYDGNQSFSITTDSGHKIQNVVVDGVSMGEISTYKFENVISNHTISANFEPIADIKPEPSTHIVEMGEVFVNHEWQRVGFTEIFIDPVVVAKPASLNGREPAVVRIRKVDTSGFEVRIQEWDYLDGLHHDEQISYLVIEKGSYVLPGDILMEAGSFKADGNNFKFNPFSGTFNEIPVVITSVTSINESNAVVGRIRNVSHEGFEYYLQREEKNKKNHGVETVSFIACEPFSGVMNNLTLEVGTTGNLVNNNFHYLSYNEKFLNIPYFLADMQTTNDTETANIRWQNKNLYSIELHISEENSRDAELNHSNENVGYIIISD